jgi:hypothetical protein
MSGLEVTALGFGCMGLSSGLGHKSARSPDGLSPTRQLYGSKHFLVRCGKRHMTSLAEDTFPLFPDAIPTYEDGSADFESSLPPSHLQHGLWQTCTLKRKFRGGVFDLLEVVCREFYIGSPNVLFHPNHFGSTWDRDYPRLLR